MRVSTIGPSAELILEQKLDRIMASVEWTATTDEYGSKIYQWKDDFPFRVCPIEGMSEEEMIEFFNKLLRGCIRLRAQLDPAILDRLTPSIN